MNIILMGSYGFKNIGDDLSIQQLIQLFSSKEVIKNIFVFCEEDYSQITNNKVIYCNTHKLSTLQKASIFILNESKTAKEGVELVLQERSQLNLTVSPVLVGLRS